MQVTRDDIIHDLKIHPSTYKKLEEVCNEFGVNIHAINVTPMNIQFLLQSDEKISATSFINPFREIFPQYSGTIQLNLEKFNHFRETKNNVAEYFVISNVVGTLLAGPLFRNSILYLIEQRKKDEKSYLMLKQELEDHIFSVKTTLPYIVSEKLLNHVLDNTSNDQTKEILNYSRERLEIIKKDVWD